MKSRPILFSAPMVRALLAGTKTQTRRVVNPQPKFMHLQGASHFLLPKQKNWEPYGLNNFARVAQACSPYGAPGDQLWVREEHHITLRDPRSVSVRYLADDVTIPEITIGPREFGLFAKRKRPAAVTRARFMWPCLSRITLEIVSVRVERLQDISEADAAEEGVEATEPFFGCPTWKSYREDNEDISALSARESYESLWESINGPGSWAANPWVWVVEFRRVQP